MKLSEKQARFSDLMILLKVYTRLALGEDYRLRQNYSYRGAPCNAAIGGHARSNHLNRLAEDLLLDRRVNGRWRWQKKTEDYRQLGEFWEELGESLGYRLRWGGRWGDGNHFSWEHGGVK